MNWFARHPKLKWSAFAAALLAVAVAMGGLEPDPLARYKRDLAAGGEELSVVKLSPPQTKEAVGFYDEFSAIAARFAIKPIHCGALDYMGKPTNGFSIPLGPSRSQTHPAKAHGTNSPRRWSDLSLPLANCASC